MENQPQAAPQGSKSTMRIIILVVVIIFAGGAYYFLSGNNDTNTNKVNVVVNENTNATANQNVNTSANANSISNANAILDSNAWASYTDPESSITFRYPSTWIVVEYDDQSAGTTFGLRPSDLEVGDESWSAIGVAIRSNPNLLDLQTFYARATDFQNPYDASSSSVESVVRNGSSMTYFATIPGVIPISKLVFPKGDSVVEVWIGRDSATDVIDNLEEIFFEVASKVN